MRIRSLLTCLALYVWGSNAHAIQGQEYFEVFAKSKYTYCDAKILSANWKGSEVYDSKVTIGYKLRMGYTDLLNELFQSARTEIRTSPHKNCSLDDMELFSKSDVERLAQLKAMSLEKAKTTILNKVAVVSEAEARQWFDKLAAKKPDSGQEEGCVGEVPEEETPLTLFFKSGYDYCHAKLLAASWKTPVYEAKTIIGNKIANQIDKSAMEFVRQEARQHGHRCDFSETAFTANDAMKLASEWKIDVQQAKIALSDTYVSGVEQHVRAWLSR